VRRYNQCKRTQFHRGYITLSLF